MNNHEWEVSSPLFEGDKTCPLYKSWPWNGHRFFGYDLVRHLQPQLLVELGTYWGTSFFTFCQAVKDAALETECVAVDTWAGDDHTGDYGDEVFSTVQNLCSNEYEGVKTRLIRDHFIEAVKGFEDNSIELLHIDGLHTYEAVQEDFNSWLPKVAPNGVVLFHDIAESCDYGSVTFWKEISAHFPAFTFQHSWGLGVLFPKGDFFYQFMMENNFLDKLLIYEYKAELELARLQKTDLERFNDEQDRLIKHLEKEVVAAKSESDRIKSASAYKLLRRLGLA